MANLKGALGTPPPPGSKFFKFYAVLGENWLNNSFSHPPLELAPPPRRNPGSATDIRQINCRLPSPYHLIIYLVNGITDVYCFASRTGGGWPLNQGRWSHNPPSKLRQIILWFLLCNNFPHRSEVTNCDSCLILRVAGLTALSLNPRPITKVLLACVSETNLIGLLFTVMQTRDKSFSDLRIVKIFIGWGSAALPYVTWKAWKFLITVRHLFLDTEWKITVFNDII